MYIYSSADTLVSQWCQVGLLNTLSLLTKVPPSLACMSIKSNFPAIAGDLGVSGKDVSQ